MAAITWTRTVEILRAGARRRLTADMPVDSSDFDRLDSVTKGETDDIKPLTWGELRKLLGADRFKEVAHGRSSGEKESA